MKNTLSRFAPWARSQGLSLVELMVSMAIAMTVMSGVVSVLVVSKSNFVLGRELSALQENARFAVKFMTDQVRMTGFSGCYAAPLTFANSIVGSNGSWYLGNLGITGYEYDVGISSFPVDFRDDVSANTDAFVIRRGEDLGLRVVDHAPGAATPLITLNQAHSLLPGQPLVIANSDCLNIGIFQSSGPTNADATATTVEHATGTGDISPANCVVAIKGNFYCTPSGTSGTTDSTRYATGSRVLVLRSEAYYIGISESDPSIPALFRERMLLDTTDSSLYTAAEELVQGIENMQILYGLDNVGNDGVADIYVKASATTNWNNVVTVRIAMRLRSLYPVYNEDMPYDTFMDILGTDGADNYMRQIVATTVRIRNA